MLTSDTYVQCISYMKKIRVQKLDHTKLDDVEESW